MTAFKPVDETLLVTGQIAPEDMQQAKAQGVTLIVNNRPDEEEKDQPPGAAIESAARAAGLAYQAIPVGSAGFSAPQIEAMAQALSGARGKTLAFCRTGTRSIFLWALSEAKQGRDPETISCQVEAAGYDPRPIRPTLDMLAGKASE